MIRGAIFDVDGTLLDSMSIWDTIGEDYLRSLGIQPRENLAEVFKTFSMEQSAQYYQQHYGVKLSTREIIGGINRMIEDFYLHTAPLKPGAADFLQALQAAGIPLCIATATDLPLVEGALRRCGVWELFSGVFTCSSVGKSKKEPDIYRAALAHMDTPKADTWVFEDALHAAQTAHRDGFPVAAVFDPSEGCQQELHALADRFIQSFAELLPFQAEQF